ncbi:hypothetical protein LDC_2378 [sediment metagenome]|uniref:Uncharacterized protein n=1 Tax=sediment metagenome TaxID=749907 RepID=D9PLF5_9ZZZZ
MNEGAHRFGIGEPLARRTITNKEAPAGARRSSLLKIVRQRPADLLGKWQTGLAEPFAPDGNFAGIPANVIQG